MPYTTQAEIEAKIPAAVLNDALDDDGDGTADTGVLDQVIALADGEVDGYLCGLFTVPFATPPAKVKAASFAFACEGIYQRRSIPEDKNPFAKLAAWWRNHLQEVGAGKLPFDAATDMAFTPGAVITEDVDLDGSLR
jgi:phage gp36-like protein